MCSSQYLFFPVNMIDLIVLFPSLPFQKLVVVPSGRWIMPPGGRRHLLTTTTPTTPAAAAVAPAAAAAAAAAATASKVIIIIITGTDPKSSCGATTTTITTSSSNDKKKLEKVSGNCGEHLGSISSGNNRSRSIGREVTATRKRWRRQKKIKKKSQNRLQNQDWRGRGKKTKKTESTDSKSSTTTISTSAVARPENGSLIRAGEISIIVVVVGGEEEEEEEEEREDSNNAAAVTISNCALHFPQNSHRLGYYSKASVVLDTAIAAEEEHSVGVAQAKSARGQQKQQQEVEPGKYRKHNQETS